MKKNKKLWKQKFRNQAQTQPKPASPPSMPPFPGRSVPPPPAPDPGDREEIRQILEAAMLNLLREIRSCDLHELQLHTLINLTNNVARAVISNNRVQTPKIGLSGEFHPWRQEQSSTHGRSPPLEQKR